MALLRFYRGEMGPDSMNGTADWAGVATPENSKGTGPKGIPAATNCQGASGATAPIFGTGFPRLLNGGAWIGFLNYV